MLKIMKRIIAFILVVFFAVLIFSFKNIVGHFLKEEPKVIEPLPEKSITIIEGWNLKNIDEYLATTEGLKVQGRLTDFRIKDFKENYDFLSDAPGEYDLEGYLFPDTYRIFASTTNEEIARKMLDNFASKLSAEMQTEIKKQGKTLWEIITMASIVEKEVRSEKDMKIVSGIFWDRIKNGQALESCATLAYVLGVNKSQYSYEDTRIKSPYNTYINRGLPPGPIANPGLKAIEAAINPTYTEYNYFLSRPDNGETVWSKTYEEHVKNKQKYLE